MSFIIRSKSSPTCLNIQDPETPTKSSKSSYNEHFDVRVNRRKTYRGDEKFTDPEEINKKIKE